MATITKEKKEQIVEELAEKLDRARTVVFTDYKGLTVAAMNSLRDQLAEQGGDYKVIKHTLFMKALEAAKLTENGLEQYDNHPLALAFGYNDEIEAARGVYQFGREHEALAILGGFVDGRLLSAEEITALAKLPGKPELIAQALGSINAPISNFVGVLRAVLTSTVYLFSAIKQKQEA